MSTILSRLARRLTVRRQSSSRAQEATFTRIFTDNAWRDAESVSGAGSTQARGADFRIALLELIDRYGIGSMLDAPCGDFNWMRNVLAGRHPRYTGIDIVAPLIVKNTRRYGAANRRFLRRDMTRDDLPAADLVLCRDGLVHLSFADARAAVRNFRRSGSRYLLVTTFVDRPRNEDIVTGGWRVLNMQAAPFAFPPPLTLLDERCTYAAGAYRDKRLGLWELTTLADTTED